MSNFHPAKNGNLDAPRTNRLMVPMFCVILGILGLCWAGFKYSQAAHKTDHNLAFLDQFVEEKAKLDSELNELFQKAAVSHRGKTERVPSPEQTGDQPVVAEKINRPKNFFAEPLEIDLSDRAIDRRLARDAEYLASDELEGRGIRTRGLELAGDYLFQEFKKAGLSTNWYGDSPFQEFQLLNGSRRGAVQRVLFHRKGGEKYLLTPNVDFSSLMKTTMGTMTLPVVFAGYGITAPELGYDDYAGIRVAGKAVIILRQEPQESDPNSPFDGTESSRYAPVYSKIQNAISHGATAVILCDPHSPSKQAGDDDLFSSNLLKVEFSEDAFDTTIPVIHCRMSLVDEIVQEFGMTNLSEIQSQIDEDLKPRSQVLVDFHIGFEVARNRSGRSVRNVVASIEPNGADPQRTVIVGAHYDHLGRDGWGSLAIGADGEIHNGADDNASGTAVILEVARQLAAQRDKLKSRVLFIAFTAEELGLLGSKHYIRDPAVPLSQTKAMINLDMVGRLRDQLTVYGMGTAREWNQIVIPAANRADLNISGRSSGYGPSDHAVFYERGIPVLHFFTGFHPEYHRPADDSHLLNIQGMRQISRCVSEIVVELASTVAPLSPDSSGNSDLLAGGNYAELLDQPDDRPAKFGVVVSRLAEENGLQIRKILPHSVAANNGLQPGDIIQKVGDVPINSVEDLKASVSERTSGAKVPIYVKRRQLALELEVIF